MEIPFTKQQFFEIIEKYNLEIFPGQLIILVSGILSLIIFHSKIRSKNKFIGGFLAVLWLWIGIGYHLAFFTEINKAAYGFGALFVFQGLWVLIETFFRKNLEFKFTGKIIDYIAYFFIIFGLFIYPVFIYFLENSLVKIITLGLPCPSTIFTFGFFMLTNTKFSNYLLIIPALWAIVGTSAAFLFGIYPDYFMSISALTAIIFLIFRK